MEKFNTHSGIVIPLDRANVDTDAIIPKQFLKSIKKTGFGKNLFDEWRYLDHGEPDQDISSRKINPEFVLNKNDPHHEYKCFIVMRCWHPRATKVVFDVKKYNPDEVILLPLYPQYSAATSGSSIKEWHDVCNKKKLITKQVRSVVILQITILLMRTPEKF